MVEENGKPKITIPQMLEQSAAQFPGRTALRMRHASGDAWLTYTYAELIGKVKRLADGLVSLGLIPHERVALVGDNHPDWVIGYHAVLFAGGVVVPLDARLTHHERKKIVTHAEAKIIIACGHFIEEAEDLREEMPSLITVSTAERGDGHSFDRLIADAEAKADAINPDDIEPTDMNGGLRRPAAADLAAILYTSGTTGTPKGVMLSHANLIYCVDASCQVIDVNADDNFFSVLPLHHAFEATGGMLLPLRMGAAITYARSLRPNEIREDLQASNATVLLAVPLLLEKILKGIYREVKKAPPARKVLFNALTTTSHKLRGLTGGAAGKVLLKSVRKKTGMESLRYMISGGAALPSWVFNGLEDLGFTVLQGYGLSETSPVLCVNHAATRRDLAVGPPLPGTTIRINEATGEIQAAGPGVMTGYYKNPLATKDVFTEDGWFCTGDIGRLDDDGLLYITGRKKSVIVTAGGKNIYPEEIEEALLISPFIEEALVVPGFNKRTGDEQVEAHIFPSFDEVTEYFLGRGTSSPSVEEINQLISNEIKERTRALADYKRPKSFVVRPEEFPKTTTQKIKRYLFTDSSVEVTN